MAKQKRKSDPNQPPSQTISDDEVRRIAKQVRKKLWKSILSWAGILSLVFGIGLWQAYTHATKFMEKLLVSSIANEFKQPRIRATVQDVAETEAKHLLQDEVKPEVDKFKTTVSNKIDDFTANLLDSLDKMQADIINIKKQYKPLDLHIASVDKQAYLLGLYFNAYLGTRDAYKKLVSETRNKNAYIRDYAVVLKSNIDNYYNSYKIDDKNIRTVFFAKKPNIHNYRPSAELAYLVILKSDNHQQREAEINNIHDRNLIYFSEFLVSIVTNDPNIKVAIMASRALGKFANQKFSSVPPYNDIDQWWHKYGCSNDLYMMPFKLIDKGNEEVKAHKYDNAVKLFEQAVKGKQGFGPTLYTMAHIYLNKGEKEKAMNALKRISEGCDAQEAAMILYAKMLIQERSITNAVNILKQIKPFMDDFNSIKTDPAFISISTNITYNQLFE